MTSYCHNIHQDSKIAVIGAGVAGIATVAALRTRGFTNVTAFDKQLRPGGLWCDAYPGAKNQTGAELYEYPDKAYPDSIRNTVYSRDAKAAEVCAYLEGFIQDQAIEECFKFGVEITNVSKQADDEWILQFKDKTTDTFSYVIVCSGLYSSKPNLIKLNGREAFEQEGGVVLHTSQLKNDSIFAGKKVVIVGNGKSAVDTCRRAGRLAEKTGSAPIIQLVRRTQWFFPMHILGLIHIKYALLTRFSAAMLPRYYLFDSFLSKLMHGIAAPFKFFFWRMVEIIFLCQFRLPWNMTPKFGGLDKEALNATAASVREEDLRPYRTGQVQQLVAKIDHLEAGKVVLSNGDMVEADVIVLATGWKTGLGLLDEETVKPLLDLDDDGLWLYRHILPPKTSGLAFVGSNASTFTNPTTATIQACWLGDLLAGIREWPSEESMADNAEQEKQFKRALYSCSIQRGASIFGYMLTYQDLLIADMGIDPMRYGGGPLGAFCNWMLPVVPSDFGGILLYPESREAAAKLCPPTALYVGAACFAATFLLYLGFASTSLFQQPVVMV